MVDIDKVIKKLIEAKQPRREFVQLMEEFKNPYLVLIACILSLRTNDLTTYPATLRMLEIGREPKDFACCDVEKLAKAIYPVNVLKNYGKNFFKISPIEKILIDSEKT